MPIQEPPLLGIEVVHLPVVVHVIHTGEEVGVGANLSKERILRQIEIINEDFRRKEKTRGYNEHPDGGDAKIEFVLAKSNPDSEPIDGINRINMSIKEINDLGYNQNHYAQFAYWDPSKYINIWTTPLPLDTECLVLGSATGPKTDLPGTQLLATPKQGDAEGILINWMHFGESNIVCHARYGRTLTHEMGHFLGLLHTWGGHDCELNDYCDDTPAVDEIVFGRNSFEGCSGETIMIGNYMNYSDDDVMNIFTKEQIQRIYYVLDNHIGRNSLMTSPALQL
ncbi:hypothetical protein KO529_03805 [Arenibacter algicola]|uniref:M43 family zinc metalloprotease n=1 Tax=Arenibacter algicola TaxID=616991 RepID=UPI001C0724CC|nr:M43 family zinc metalloprotease [Arenibacter algicola]MBU2903898.1 hypothetical protein [Arenibacter algicola]